MTIQFYKENRKNFYNATLILVIL